VNSLYISISLFPPIFKYTFHFILKFFVSIAARFFFKYIKQGNNYQRKFRITYRTTTNSNFSSPFLFSF